MDPIADMIIQIKNGSLSSKESVLVPYSKLKATIADVLVEEGFLKSLSKRSKKSKNFLELFLAYDNFGKAVVHDVKRISKPSRRMYAGSSNLRPERNGYGTVILSTPKGILTDKKARKEHVGGEILLSIW